MKIFVLVTMTFWLGMATAFAVGPERNYATAGFPIYENEYAGPVKFSKSKPDHVLKIVSYNIKFSENLEKVIFQLKYNPRLKNAKVIFLQEVVGIPGDAHGHAAEVIAKELGMNYAYAPAFVHQKNDLDFGVAILSKFPLKNVTKIILPHLHFKQKTQRIALGATVHVGGRDLRVYSTHLETLQKSSQRIDQMDAIMDDVQKYPEGHYVIGGDFNTAPFWHRTKLLRFIKKMGFKDATRGIGVTMKKVLGLIQFKLDHIFTRGMWILGRGKANYTDASDHRPIWIVTRIRTQPSIF